MRKILICIDSLVVSLAMAIGCLAGIGMLICVALFMGTLMIVIPSMLVHMFTGSIGVTCVFAVAITFFWLRLMRSESLMQRIDT